MKFRKKLGWVEAKGTLFIYALLRRSGFIKVSLTFDGMIRIFWKEARERRLPIPTMTTLKNDPPSMTTKAVRIVNHNCQFLQEYIYRCYAYTCQATYDTF